MTGAGKPGRARILYGTDEPVVPMRHLAAGSLSAKFDRGNLRYVSWGGLEVLRAIAFIIRDTGWGTYDPAISGLDIVEEADRFTVRYTARVTGAEGSFRYATEITGSADGRLTFRADGGSDDGFATNRTGFVVLHPLQCVVGHEVDVEHASGGSSTARFPERVSPIQPILDIRALSHAPAKGIRVTVRMEGDAFETEDHRNWTDASFKTYVRPLSRGFPYTIAAGEQVSQSVTLTVEGRPPVTIATEGGAVVRLGETSGTMPAIGLVAHLAGIQDTAASAGRIAELQPSYLVARVDGRGDLAELASIAKLARAVAPLALDIIIAGRAPAEELAKVREAITAHDLRPDQIFVIPARDLRGRTPNTTPSGEADAAAILAAARHAFPGVRLGGGMPIAFTELNRNRPPAGIDFVTHATQATVHAADDVSVMETLQSLPDVIASVRAIAGGAQYRLGPATIGAPAETYYAAPAKNPDGRRMAQAEDDPRQRGLFAAAFALGYTAAAARAGVEALTLGACLGPAGVLSSKGKTFPVGEVVRRLAALAGRPRIAVSVDGTAKLAAIAAKGADGPVLWLANLSPAPVEATLPGQPFTRLWRMDAETLAGRDPESVAAEPFAGGPLRLDAYAVCRLS